MISGLRNAKEHVEESVRADECVGCATTAACASNDDCCGTVGSLSLFDRFAQSSSGGVESGGRRGDSPTQCGADRKERARSPEGRCRCQIETSRRGVYWGAFHHIVFFVSQTSPFAASDDGLRGPKPLPLWGRQFVKETRSNTRVTRRHEAQLRRREAKEELRSQRGFSTDAKEKVCVLLFVAVLPPMTQGGGADTVSCIRLFGRDLFPGTQPHLQQPQSVLARARALARRAPG